MTRIEKTVVVPFDNVQTGELSRWQLRIRLEEDDDVIIALHKGELSVPSALSAMPKSELVNQLRELLSCSVID